MKMKKVVLSLLAVTMVGGLFGGCLENMNSKSSDIDFRNVVDDINNKRQSVLKEANISGAKRYMYEVEGDKQGFDNKEIEELLSYERSPESITKEKALEDVECLFRIFKYVYGGYGYYGGDEKFQNMKSRIIDRIEGDEILVSLFNEIIQQELSDITDGHLNIAGKFVNENSIQQYYCNQNIEVRKNELGFYIMIEGKKSYITKIEGREEIDKYLKLSVNKEGEIVYYFGILQREEEAVDSILAEHKISSDILRLEVPLAKVNSKSYVNRRSFQYTKYKDVPVLKLRKLTDRKKENNLKDFVESGLSVKNEKVFFIDLRGNGGGSDAWCDLWFQNYTGNSPEAGRICMKRYSKVYLKASENIEENIMDEFIEKYDMPKIDKMIREYYAKRAEALKDGRYDTWSIDEEKSEWVENDNLIFVLIDKGVGSSAEDFIMYLKTLENVVLVGSNTRGLQRVEDQQRLYLPNSKSLVYLGAGLVLFKDGEEYSERIGAKPDLWLDNKDMMDRLVELCKRNNIN